LKDKRLLILAAHPDDETLGCGATAYKLSNLGYKTQLITFTVGVGSRNDNKKNRNYKLEKISSILKIHSVNSGNFPDNAMDRISLLDVCKFIESNVDYFPDIIFTHSMTDLNVDHQIVTKAGLIAFRPQTGNNIKIYSYFIPSSTDYNPTMTFDGGVYFKLTENEVKVKMKALKVYDDEMRKYPHSRSYTNVKNLMKVWGSEVGAKYCEKFKLLREIL
jgi:LmbE family N-acetylglucosaminyl deacetylase